MGPTVGAEYIDDDQVATSQATGDCLTRSTRDRNNLGENVTYVVDPGIWPIQIGTFRGSGDVTLVLECTLTLAAATRLKSNPDRCAVVCADTHQWVPSLARHSIRLRWRDPPTPCNGNTAFTRRFVSHRTLILVVFWCYFGARTRRVLVDSMLLLCPCCVVRQASATEVS